jgi:hypothetical protein
MALTVGPHLSAGGREKREVGRREMVSRRGERAAGKNEKEEEKVGGPRAERGRERGFCFFQPFTQNSFHVFKNKLLNHTTKQKPMHST